MSTSNRSSSSASLHTSEQKEKSPEHICKCAVRKLTTPSTSSRQQITNSSSSVSSLRQLTSGITSEKCIFQSTFKRIRSQRLPLPLSLVPAIPSIVWLCRRDKAPSTTRFFLIVSFEKRSLKTTYLSLVCCYCYNEPHTYKSYTIPGTDTWGRDISSGTSTFEISHLSSPGYSSSMFTYAPGGCYHPVSLTALTDAATTACTKEDSTLASVFDENKEDYLFGRESNPAVLNI